MRELGLLDIARGPSSVSNYEHSYPFKLDFRFYSSYISKGFRLLTAESRDHLLSVKLALFRSLFDTLLLFTCKLREQLTYYLFLACLTSFINAILLHFLIYLSQY